MVRFMLGPIRNKSYFSDCLLLEDMFYGGPWMVDAGLITLKKLESGIVSNDTPVRDKVRKMGDTEGC